MRSTDTPASTADAAGRHGAASRHEACPLCLSRGCDLCAWSGQVRVVALAPRR